MNDLDLLRRYEPVVRYTEGEMFFPCAVDAHLRAVACGWPTPHAP
ncbi:MAG: hypothetical protein R2851_05425 [Caldilineaceae bacterium]